MMEIWFWISKEVAELGLAILGILIVMIWFSSYYFIEKFRGRLRAKRIKDKKNRS